LYLVKCALFNDPEQKEETKYKIFLHDLARSQISETKNRNQPSSEVLQLAEKKPTPRIPIQDPSGRLSRDHSKHKWRKTLLLRMKGRNITHRGSCFYRF
jgi:hypothetical protein